VFGKPNGLLSTKVAPTQQLLKDKNKIQRTIIAGKS
jgi:hypothetical protein